MYGAAARLSYRPTFTATTEAAIACTRALLPETAVDLLGGHALRRSLSHARPSGRKFRCALGVRFPFIFLGFQRRHTGMELERDRPVIDGERVHLDRRPVNVNKHSVSVFP